MTTTNTEPRNPLYLALLVVSLLFVLTALAYAIIPTLQERAVEAGAIVPESAFRDSLKKNGGKWLLWQLGGMFVLGLASMWVDRQRLRRLQNASEGVTMPPQSSAQQPSPPLRESHENPQSTREGTERPPQLP